MDKFVQTDSILMLSGTPIVQFHSPFQSVPQYSKFGVNMTEHIAFENLPNATGKWDDMRNGIIKKVREKMSGIRGEAEEA